MAEDTLDVVRRWREAVWIDRDTAAALQLMHPEPLGVVYPAADIGATLRDQYPWIGDPAAQLGRPRQFGADTEAVPVVLDGEQAEILVGQRLGTELQEVRLVIAVVRLADDNARASG